MSSGSHIHDAVHPHSDPNNAGFSCPHRPLDVERVEEICAGHFRRVCLSFLSRYGAVLDRSPGLGSFLRGWLNGRADFETVWDPSFGKIRELLLVPKDRDTHRENAMDRVDRNDGAAMLFARGDEADVLERGAEVGLRLAECGFAGEFRLALARPARLRWGPWLLPMADSLAIETDGRRALVETSLSGVPTRVRMERDDDGWKSDRGTRLTVVDLGRGPVYVVAADAAECREHGHGHLPFPPAELSRVLDELKAAVALTAEFAPAYLPWILRVVRHISVVTAVPAGELASGSFVHRPSAIFVASPMPVAVLAELLAHEACHQHFWLVTQLGPVDDGTQRRPHHYSPYVDKHRNLRMMLLTYHAFANAVLFHRDCSTRGLVDPLGQARERQFAALFEPYERALRESPSLTPLGRQLWETLAEEVQSRAAGTSERA